MKKVCLERIAPFAMSKDKGLFPPSSYRFEEREARYILSQVVEGMKFLN
jgi:hypothetical protein